MEFRFRHRILNFNPVGVLLALGITPATYPFRYYGLITSAYNIIGTQVELSALKLNKLLITLLGDDMLHIGEYARFPRYITVMSNVLSRPEHVGTYWDNKNVIQAKFIDLQRVGDVGDLQAVQQLVYPLGGSLEGWRGLYVAWMSGRSDTYATTVNRRLDIMESEGIAPFIELVVDGNQQYPAYPHNGPMRTFDKINTVYNQEMLLAYASVLRLVQSLALAPDPSFRSFGTASVVYNDQTYFGFSWKSRVGKNVFALAGTEKLVGNRFVARGFILSPSGGVLNKWSGWLPR